MTKPVKAKVHEAKRPYRKNNPLSAYERQRAMVARMKETHKEIRIYLLNASKENLDRLCKARGLAQAKLLEELIDAAAQELG